MITRRLPWADLLTLDDWKREAARLAAGQPEVTLRAPGGTIMTFRTAAARDAFIERQVYGRGVLIRTYQFKRPT